MENEQSHKDYFEQLNSKRNCLVHAGVRVSEPMLMTAELSNIGPLRSIVTEKLIRQIAQYIGEELAGSITENSSDPVGRNRDFSLAVIVHTPQKWNEMLQRMRSLIRENEYLRRASMALPL